MTSNAISEQLAAHCDPSFYTQTFQNFHRWMLGMEPGSHAHPLIEINDIARLCADLITIGQDNANDAHARLVWQGDIRIPKESRDIQSLIEMLPTEQLPGCHSWQSAITSVYEHEKDGGDGTLLVGVGDIGGSLDVYWTRPDPRDPEAAAGQVEIVYTVNGGRVSIIGRWTANDPQQDDIKFGIPTANGLPIDPFDFCGLIYNIFAWRCPVA